jgi:hypothetical protein
VIIYKKAFLRCGEAWFDEKTDGARLDLLWYRQRENPVSDARCREFYTILINLRKDPDALLADMHGDTRYQIRRAAAKDALSYESLDTKAPDSLVRFCDFYDEFATQKNRAKVDREHLMLLVENKSLDLSRVSRDNCGSLVWHAHFRTRDKVRLLYSASHYRAACTSAQRSFIGRANRHHHWQDILRFKAEGISTYDFGGWYEGSADQEKLRINDFKEKFGGEIVKQFNCVRAVTIRGKLAIRVQQMLRSDAP